MKMLIVVLLTVEENGNRNLQQEGRGSLNYAGALDGSLTNKNYHLKIMWEFSGGPVVKTLRFHCRGHRFNPWLEN